MTFGRDLAYSFEPRQPYYVDNGVGLSIRRALTGPWDVLVSADRHVYDYRDLVPPSGAMTPTNPRRDTTWNYQGTVGYRIGRDGRVGGGFSYWRRDSGAQTLSDYDGLRIRVTFSYGL